MTASVSVRRRVNNHAPKAIAQSAVFQLVAARVASPDAIETVLRTEFDGPLDVAKRRITAIARNVAERGSTPVLAEVLDSDNALLFTAEVQPCPAR
ncbi:MAG: hypothetical protein NXI31_10765 [bacterium]|nr:hypothetical protein [bacterium]